MTTKIKWAILAVCGLFLVCAVNPSFGAINTRKIKEVREKPVLDSNDFKIIDSFVAEAVQELVETRDFSEVGEIRTVILTYASSDKPSKAQYERQFFDSAYKYLSQALEKARQDDKFMVVINLLILIERFENLRFAELAIGALRDENPIVRYLAVHSVTNRTIVEQLNKNPENSRLARQITEQLKGLVDSSSPETLALVAEFSGTVEIAQAEDLLLLIADIRMKDYMEWTVAHETLDETLLKSLCDKISYKGQSRPAVAQRFGQLYSYAIQRYIKGQYYLGDHQKQQLISVLIETEQECIRKAVGPTVKIKKAIEQNDYETLWLEHSRLLGDETRAGLLPREWNFHYGRNANGEQRTAPLELPEPPKLKTSNKN